MDGKPFEYPNTQMDRGKILWDKDIEELKGNWARYLDKDGDGIPYRTVPGNRHPMSAYFTRGTGHDENARYTEDSTTWVRVMDRLKKKHALGRQYMPKPILHTTPGATVDVIAYGSTESAVQEAIHQLDTQHGIKADFLRVRASLKDRSARLSLGHRGLAIWYDGTTGTWQSHGGNAPWLTARRAAVLAPWTPLERVPQLAGVPDAQRGEVGEKGFGPVFPHDPRTTPNPRAAVFAMPLGNDVVLDTALAAIDGEALGADRDADLLVISPSAHDYIAHGWGHESWEAWDTALRFDEALAHFLDELGKVGRGAWAMIMTSDHGGSPLPEALRGGRYTMEQLARAANHAASTVLGPGAWIANATYPNV